MMVQVGDGVALANQLGSEECVVDCIENYNGEGISLEDFNIKEEGWCTCCPVLNKDFPCELGPKNGRGMISNVPICIV